MRSYTPAALAVLLGSLPLAAGTPSVTPEEWALSGDPLCQKHGAMVLEKRIAFKNTYIEYAYRIRIVNEQGRKAAEFKALSEHCYDITGCVIQRDGKTVKVDRAKDMETRTWKVDSLDLTEKAMVMPGLTSDCVVELSWKEAAKPLPLDSPYAMRWSLDSTWPTRRSVVEMPFRFEMVTQVLSPVNLRRDIKDGLSRVVTYFDLPAVPDEPYAYTTDTRSILFLYHQPAVLRNHAEEGLPGVFWGQAAARMFEPFLKAERGRTFRAFSQELLLGVKGSPQEMAREVTLRLDHSITNLASLTLAEQATRGAKHKAPDLTDLDAAVRRKEASSLGMALILVNLLRDLGLKPHVAFVTPRHEGTFTWDMCSIWQWSDMLVGVEEPGKPMLWLDAGLRNTPPGMIHPSYQGTECLVLDGATGSMRQVALPYEGAEGNLRSYTYALEPGEEGVGFRVKAQFGGTSAHYERRAFQPVEAEEQGRRLKERLEGASRGLQVAKAEVTFARNSRQPFGWTAEGTLPAEGGRRLEVQPFPGMPWPLDPPTTMTDTRRSRIMLPYARTQRAEASFQIPKGFRMLPAGTVELENSFGKVRWQAVEEGGRVKVDLEVVLSKVSAYPSAQRNLKTWFASLEEAMKRVVVLEREA